jgi:polysaccharide deacetylase 2 family uncharacterized protein YibQ
VAKTPRDDKQASARAVKFRRPAPSALAVVVFLLLASTAGLAAWLNHRYEPPVITAGTMELVLPIDLTKEGHGQKAAPKLAARPDVKQSDEVMPPARQQLKGPATANSGEIASQPESHAQVPGPRLMNSKPKLETDSPAAAPAGQPATAAHPPGPQPEPQVQLGNAPGAEAVRLAGAAQTGRDGKMAQGGLRPAPDPALIKSTDDGPLPVVAPDGRTPLQVYARPYRATGRPRIAVVIGSLGLSQATTLAAIQQLPGGVTLAFAPYGRNLQDYVNQARAAGHEVLLQVPMEPMDYPTNDPGPHTLLTSLTINNNLKRLDWLFGRFAGYVGVVNFMGGRFTSAESHVRPILEAIRDRGLMFLYTRASSSIAAGSVVGKTGLHIAASDRVVDAIASRDAIDARLLELERLATASGGAIGIGFPYPVTIERLTQWTRTMGDRGYDLVPVSALADYQEASP